MLFFLSDGKPSDAFSKKGVTLDQSNKQILNEICQIFVYFQENLTFGAFGFAYDDGEIF